MNEETISKEDLFKERIEQSKRIEELVFEIERLHNIIEEVEKVLNDKRRIMTMKLLDGSYCDYEELLYQVDEEIRKILDKENKYE